MSFFRLQKQNLRDRVYLPVTTIDNYFKWDMTWNKFLDIFEYSKLMRLLIANCFTSLVIVFASAYSIGGAFTAQHVSPSERFFDILLFAAILLAGLRMLQDCVRLGFYIKEGIVKGAEKSKNKHTAQ